MALKVFRAGDTQYGRTMKLLVCGEPGAGKTRFASQFPNPFYASAEGGLMSVVDRRVPATEIKNSADLLILKDILEQPSDVRGKLLGVPVSTVVIDTIDEIQKILIRERLTERRQEQLQMADWGWLGDQLRMIVRSYRNLSDVNVIFTCHLKSSEDSTTGQMFIKPSLQGAMQDEIAAQVDLALLLRTSIATKVVNNEAQRIPVRVMQSHPDPQHTWVKDRSGRLPLEFDINFNDDYDRMKDLIFGQPVAASEHLAEAEDPNTGPAPVPAPEAEPVKAKRRAATKSEPSPTPAVEPDDTAPAPELLTSEGGPPGEPTSGEANTEPEPEPEPEELDVVQEAAVAELRDEIAAIENRPAPEIATPVAQPVTPPAGRYACADCGEIFDDEDQYDMAMTRFHRPLDRACFKTAKSVAR